MTNQAPIERRRLRRVAAVCVALALVVGGLTSASAPAAAAPLTWTQSTVTPRIANGTLGAVSCPTSTSCVAVGSFVNTSGNRRALSMTWNGTTWTNRTTPVPTGARETVLESVSCRATTFCHAVGWSTSSTGRKAMSMTWNGSAWTVRTTPNPSGSTGTFVDSVSCIVSTTTCVAVGYYFNPTVGAYRSMSMTWNGSAWTLRGTPNPSGSTGTFPDGLVCRTASHCMAVGYYSSSAGTRALSMTWNGSAWTLRTTPTPTGATYVRLTSVSCASTTSCMAAGYHTTSSTRSLSMTWNGSAWTVRTTPNPSTSTGTFVQGVACSTATACLAVGYHSTVASGYRPLSMTWNGSTWTTRTTPVRAGVSGTFLSGVACTGSTACTAVGNTPAGQRLTLAMRWGGSSWVIQTTPSPIGTIGSSFAEISCTAENACTAVGEMGAFGGDRPMAMSWNGTSWSTATVPAPTGATESFLEGVSCSSATACMAVGAYKTTGDHRPLAISRSGSTWTVRSVPMPAGASTARLRGVSCTSPSACTAVGEFEVGTETFMMGHTWDGMTWTLANVPEVALVGNATESLYEVSCKSATSCLAVGYWLSSAGRRPAVMARTGATWVWSPTPSSVTGNLTGVSCDSTSSCHLWGTRLGATTAALRWQNGVYTTYSTPNPGTQNWTTGFSCSSSTECTGVGYRTDTDTAFAVDMDGGSTWTASSPPPTTVPTSTGVTTVEAHGIACTSATVCIAVGFQRGLSVTVPYVVRSS